MSVIVVCLFESYVRVLPQTFAVLAISSTDLSSLTNMGFALPWGGDSQTLLERLILDKICAGLLEFGI